MSAQQTFSDWRNNYALAHAQTPRAAAPPAPLWDPRYPLPIPASTPALQPWPHQRETAEYLLIHRRAAVLDAMGTGKTLACIWAAEYLLRTRHAQRVLILAPKSTTEHVWHRTLRDCGLRSALALGSGANKRAVAAGRTPWLVTNHDGFQSVYSVYDPDLVIYDEATAIKHTKSQRHKYLATWLKHACRADTVRLWLLTGTPMAQSPLDAYGLIRLLRPHHLPGGLTAWRDMTMRPVSKFKFVPKEDAAQTCAEWLRPAIRHEQPQQFEVRYDTLRYSLTPLQTALVKQLRASARAELSAATITAPNAAAVISKVLQAYTGALIDTATGDTHQLPAGPLLDSITEYVDAADTPVLVFAPFRAAVARIVEHLSIDGRRVYTVTGETTDSDRARAFDAVQRGQGSGGTVLVAIPGAMAHGVTLTAARYVLWVAPTFRAETWEQANARVIRPGQLRSVVITRLSADAFVDALFKRLETKASLQDAVLSLL